MYQDPSSPQIETHIQEDTRQGAHCSCHNAKSENSSKTQQQQNKLICSKMYGYTRFCMDIITVKNKYITIIYKTYINYNRYWKKESKLQNMYSLIVYMKFKVKETIISTKRSWTKIHTSFKMGSLLLGKKGKMANEIKASTLNSDALLLKKHGKLLMCVKYSSLYHGLPWRLRWQRILLKLRRPGFDPWVRKILWRREWRLTPVLLPGEFLGQRSLVGYSPQCCKESDMTEQLLDTTEPLTHTHSVSFEYLKAFIIKLYFKE